MKIIESAVGKISVDGKVFEPFEALPGVVRAQKVAVAEAIQVQEAFELVHNNGKVETGNPGDWILRAGERDIYVVRDQVFRKLYRIV
jgi:hypothetical protein